MSTVGSTLMDCPDVQAELNNFFLSCDTATIGFRSPFNEFLWNPINRKGLQQVINPGPGKVKNVQLRYDQAIPLSQVLEGAMSDISCTATTKRGDLTASYTIDPDDILYVEEKFAPSDFYNACRDNPSIIMRKLTLMMKALREATYKKTADDFVGNTMWGEWSNIVSSTYTVTNDFLQVKTKKDSSIDPYPTSMFQINNSVAQSNFCEAPFIVGGNSLYEYAQIIAAGCCASNGVNIGDILAKYGYAVAWDKYLQASSAFNDVDKSVAIQPGALQVIYFNEYEQDAAMSAAVGTKVGRNYDSFVITDPVSGMPINVIISDNCRVVSIFMHTCTKLVGLPADLFAVGDDLEGVNFVTAIEVANV